MRLRLGECGWPQEFGTERSEMCVLGAEILVWWIRFGRFVVGNSGQLRGERKFDLEGRANKPGLSVWKCEAE